MLKTVARLELAASILLLAPAAWPISGLCSGRFLSLDRESRAIFAVNLLGPLGLLARGCSVWSLASGSVRSHIVLGMGAVALLACWFFHAL